MLRFDILKTTLWLGESAILETSQGLQAVKGPPKSTFLIGY